MIPTGRLGAFIETAGKLSVVIWAPFAKRVDLRFVFPTERIVPMKPRTDGYWKAEVEDAGPGSRYFVRLDGTIDRPDPASRSQPESVHGSSEVVDESFSWTDASWHGRPLRDMVIYELHVGAFSPSGDFAGVIERLDELVDLGVNTIEVMPIARFPGDRNWGYDGVYPYAAQTSYGALSEFKRLVNECHTRGLAVVLDVVYNHLGPEGNYLADFGPYFTDRYRTPWGRALNFDGPHSDGVRHYFIASALEWMTECHVDGFRLDAVHAIFDHSPRHFLQELADRVHEAGTNLGREVVLIAETNKNDPLIVTPRSEGGLGVDGQWPDDFSRSLQGLLSGDRFGYYADYGTVEHVAKAYREAFVLTGQYSHYRRRNHGQSAAHVPADRFVACVQNHDQIGNRAGSDRLSKLVDFESLKLAATAVILSPYVPLLFMGEEYGETAPFNYFIDHGDRALCKAVHRGRIAEFVLHAWQHTPLHPKALRTFLASKLNHALKHTGQHAELRRYYQELLRLRRELPAIREARRDRAEVVCDATQQLIVAHRWSDSDEIAVAMNFSDREAPLTLPGTHFGGDWQLKFSSAASGPHTVARRSATLFISTKS